ncbi:hypothetical protein FHL15_003286 [Xylaria flabelliformis]|uniref:C3H1-type domain-containing protein n=1 Tax=Xylaria flabelliformis TaxID=2512241 RepID=A0A553I6A9_9PEZI|nr:hypothetical protein FHL15_003286 [Xylaria flabelliformis]
MDSPPRAAASNNSPSNLSRVSGLSHISTPSTSPDSTSTNTISSHTSPLIDLDGPITNIKHTSNTLLDPNSKINMDRSSFQSINDRRNKLANERLTVNQFPHTQQQQLRQQQLASPPSQGARSNGTAPFNHHRSLASANWRAQTTLDGVFPQNHITYSPPDAYHSHPSLFGSFPFPNARVDQYQYLPSSSSVTSYPNFNPISDTQLDSSFAYCYDRGNGQYTRLIPADMLPALHNIPALEQSCVGMLVVPQPRASPPNGHSSNTQPVSLRAISRALSSPAMSLCQRLRAVIHSPHQQVIAKLANVDYLQSRIDNIVAATPQTPAYLPGHVGSGPSLLHNAPPTHRRVKVYCDKWVHEGVCAFTQQGCKYKHEMPEDQETQRMLGLFHGYPQWWKKRQADLSRPRDAPPSEVPKNCGQTDSSGSKNQRYIGRINNSASENRGTRSGSSGLTSDTGRQHAWHTGGGYIGDPQVPGPVSSIGQAATSRMSGTTRNYVATRTPDNTLSPCQISYGSPFGPIAPPPRSNATGTISSENMRGPSGLQPRRTASFLLSNNPYASLDTLEDGSDQYKSDEPAYTEAGARLL